jgi:hypothetical protein
MLTVYARKEPTRDTLAIQHKLDKKDVVFYRDEACTDRFCHWSWHLSPPRRNRKTVTLNCYRWAVKWVADAIAPATVPAMAFQ